MRRTTRDLPQRPTQRQEFCRFQHACRSIRRSPHSSAARPPLFLAALSAARCALRKRIAILTCVRRPGAAAGAKSWAACARHVLRRATSGIRSVGWTCGTETDTGEDVALAWKVTWRPYRFGDLSINPRKAGVVGRSDVTLLLESASDWILQDYGSRSTK